ncbi:MAG: hypothetical protein K0U71_05685 [Actinomycetia bacterium]|nr:hypothetical protein [Actinomycetes bacterium]
MRMAPNRAKGLRALATTATIALIAIVGGGCGHSESAPQAATLTNQSPSTVTPAPAGPDDFPDDFPDLSSYSEASYDVYAVIDSPRVQGFAFTTPDGLQCANNAYPTPEFEWVSCQGPRPDQGPGIWSVSAQQSAPATVERSAPEDLEMPGTTAPPLMPPLTRVTAQKGNSTCGVGPNGTTACRVGDHGFVLTPTSTTLF